MADVALQSIFDEARRALDSGDADLAIGIVQHVLRYAPDVIEGHRLLGEAYLNAGQSEQAVAAFEAVLRADPENIAAYYGLGLAQQGLDRRMEAIHAFERALEIQPNLADLRTQLLQLYAETPGSAGQFRLSRSGLGRLYARGQMYAQAIDEFRAVLENEPDRDDVRVALAETLWRDGQEDEAADWCREIIRRQPELHKPTVILGYLQLAGGQPEGEALWRRAARQDPALQTAYALFDILPPVQIAEPVIPAFDERAWREEQTRPMVEPPVEAVRVAVPSEDDITVPRQESMQAPVASPPQPRDTAVLSDDDLLASLLGLDGEETTDAEPAPFQQPAPSSDAEDSMELAPATPLPASLDEIGLRPSEFPQSGAPAAVDATTGGDERTAQQLGADDIGADVQPFPLDDQPLADDDMEDLGHVEPFSLNDLDFDTDEETPEDVRPVPAVDEETPAAATPAADEASGPAASAAARALGPDALAVEQAAGKTAEDAETHNAEQPGRAEAIDTASGPFASIDVNEEERSHPGTNTTADELPTMASETPDPPPFSFADLGLSEDDFADLRLDEHTDESTPFSLADPEVTGEPLLAPVEPEAFEAPARASTDADAIEQPGSIEDQARTGAARERDTRSTAAREQPRPFSLADLGLTDEELAQLDTQPTADLSGEADGDWSLSGGETDDTRKPDETRSFSLADLGLSDEELELFGVVDDQAYTQPDTEPSMAEQPFSWMDPAVRGGSQPAEATPPPNDASLAPSWLANLPTASEPTGATPESPDPQQNSTPTPELPTDAITFEDQDASAGSVPSVPAELRHFHEQLAAQPDNHGMRLAVARMSEQKGEIEGAIEQYKQLIKRNALLEAVVEDLQEMVTGEYDRPLLRRLHRLLGDAYMKQNRMEEAMAEYSWA